MAASAAFAVNVGLLLHDDTKPLGVLDASAIESTTTTAPIEPTVVTVIVEDPPIQGASAAASDPAYAAEGASATEPGAAYSDDSVEIEHADDDSPSGDPVEVVYDDDDD